MPRQSASPADQSLLHAVNWVVEDHATLPPVLTVQLDNATTNKNMVVFAMGGLLVYHKVFQKVPTCLRGVHCAKPAIIHARDGCL